jgi:hypothetical protein
VCVRARVRACGVGVECGPTPVPRFIEVHGAFETVKTFFYVCHIGKRDEQRI